MNLPEFERKVIAVARANPPRDNVPYAFEKRIMARLNTPLTLDHWAVWSRALWRAAAPCVAVTLLLSAWSVFAPPLKAPSTDLSQELENTLLAAADADQPADSVR